MSPRNLDDSATLVHQALDSFIRERMRQHIYKIIEPDILKMVGEFMQDFKPQIESFYSQELDKRFIEIILTDRRSK